MVELILKDIDDIYSRQNFFRLSKFFNEEAILNGSFKFFEIVITAANTTVSIPHGLNFIPQDIIFLSVDGNYNFYFEYANFDRTNIKIFVEGPCKLRFFAGAYKDQNYGRKVSDLTLVPPNSAGGSATTWFTGVGPPGSGLGSIGDFYLDTVSSNVYLKTGPVTWVVEGSIAPNSPATVWFTGSGAPASGLGVVGDFYLDTSTDDVYLKTAPLVWTLSGSIAPNVTPDPYLGSDKLKYYLNALAAYDRISEITYLDFGLRNQRISSVTYASTAYPDSNVTKTIVYLSNGSMDRRIDHIDWTGTAFGLDTLRKVFEYDLSGFKHIVSGYYLEIF